MGEQSESDDSYLVVRSGDDVRFRRRPGLGESLAVIFSGTFMIVALYGLTRPGLEPPRVVLLLSVLAISTLSFVPFTLGLSTIVIRGQDLQCKLGLTWRRLDVSRVVHVRAVYTFRGQGYTVAELDDGSQKRLVMLTAYPAAKRLAQLVAEHLGLDDDPFTPQLPRTGMPWSKDDEPRL